jgi:RNase P/RNase MRP subunit p30
LSRITIAIDDMHDVQSLTVTSSNEYLKSFDIIAICPGTQQILTHLCKESDVDIICLDFTHRLTFSLNKKLVTN